VRHQDRDLAPLTVDAFRGLVAREARRTEPGLRLPFASRRASSAREIRSCIDSPSVRSATPTQAVILPPGTSIELIEVRTRSMTGAA